MVPHYESSAAHGAQKRFVGHEFSESEVEGVDGEWAQHSRPVEVPSIPETDPSFRELFGEYRNEVRIGALWAADAETARACGVEFDPTFKGDHAPVAAAAPRAGFVSLKGGE